MKSKNIFIHIPKTGGTTINCIMTKSNWQTQPDFNYRHILYDTKRSNAGDIFNPIKNDIYLEYEIFSMLRNPVDRIVSEYYFIKDRPEFMSLLKPVPKNLMEYVKHKQTRNYMTGFFLGKRMYDEEFVNQNDLQLVLNTIKTLNIKIGFFEEYEKSMQYFSSITGIKWPKNINIKRKTLNRPEVSDISHSIKDIILKNNQLDLELYNTCKVAFDKIKTKSNTINFIGNEYDYIMKYTQRFNLLQIGLKSTSFITKNQIFFNNINQILHEKLKLTEGKSYVIIWIDFFIKSCNNAFPNSTLVSRLNSLNNAQEPLDNLKQICKILDEELKRNNSKYSNQLILNRSYLDMSLKLKKGMFSNLKSKFKRV
nr:sulfotransferase family 2 domain-containing protein [uncultured Psychroserpens sp.]